MMAGKMNEAVEKIRGMVKEKGLVLVGIDGLGGTDRRLTLADFSLY